MNYLISPISKEDHEPRRPPTGVDAEPTMAAIQPAVIEDAAAILALQKRAYQSEAILYQDWSIPPLTETIDALIKEFPNATILKAVAGNQIIGSVRAKADGDVCAIGRLIVSPEFQGHGIGSTLLRSVEELYAGIPRFELFTGSRSESNIRLYQKAGYRITRTQPLTAAVSLVFLEKTPPQGK